MSFSQPLRQVTMMLVVLGLVVAGGWAAYARIYPIFQANPWLNGAILAVFVLGVLACFWQVAQLMTSVRWIESFARQRRGGAKAATGQAPPMLAPLAALLGERRAMAISSSASASILDSVATRIDEARDITRYLSNLLIFLGLLGTFYGLATTVPAVVDTIRALKPQDGQSGMEVFDQLMTGLEAQLGGMGTAFSSSLLGLAGSLVVGLLELFVTHGQNRFYRELEEWMTSFTKLSVAGEGGEALDHATIVGVLDQMALQMEALQDYYAHAEVGRSTLESRLGEMAQGLDRLTHRLDQGAEQGAAAPALLTRIAEAQERLTDVIDLQQRSPAALPEDAESRMRLRSIDVQLLRLVEELAAGRQETSQEMRSEIRQLTLALRALGRAAGAPMPGDREG
ncbi:biopolymer transporter ExbB [Paracoccus sp. p4-l81]|uniref:biopolymer transporter ExbB n=1 Tax=unclassified Paracoccus (in: a-proteobacteria) TaxID=2688777 RepID=UPI0035BB0790